MNPLFSIIIPLYNKEKEIENTLKSVLNQSFTDYEVIVINDGSTDLSEEKVLSIHDERIIYFKTENKGVSKARNLGIEKAKGELIAFLDADDLWFSHHLFDLKELYLKYPKAGLLVTNYEFSYANGTIIKPEFIDIPITNWSGIISDFFRSSMKYRIAWTSAVAIPKSVFKKTGAFDEENNFSNGEDVDLWIRIALEFPVAFTTIVSAQYTMDSSNKLTNLKTKDLKFPKLNKYLEQERKNSSLADFLDLYRTVYALKHKLISDSENFEFYKNSINAENITLKRKVLFEMPNGILKYLYHYNKKWNNNQFYLKLYTMVFK